MTGTEILEVVGLIAALGVLAAILFFRVVARRVIVFQHERGLRYVNGLFRDVLAPGPHWILPLRTSISRIDVRQRFVTIPGQELLTADGVAVKISIAAKFEIADPALAVNGVVDFNGALYTELQLVAREVVGSMAVESLLSDREQLSGRLTELGRPRAEALGLTLHEASLKDIMLAGRLKEVFAQVVVARQEGLAALERARGESAALRNLANAARMIDDNPNLLQLRLLQVLGETSGNTVVIGPTEGKVPLPAKSAGRRASASKPTVED